MRDIIVRLYAFSELKEEAREFAIRAWRETPISYDPVMTEVRSMLDLLGIQGQVTVDYPAIKGQGTASIEGRWYPYKALIDVFAGRYVNDKETKRILEHMQLLARQSPGTKFKLTADNAIDYEGNRPYDHHICRVLLNNMMDAFYDIKKYVHNVVAGYHETVTSKGNAVLCLSKEHRPLYFLNGHRVPGSVLWAADELEKEKISVQPG